MMDKKTKRYFKEYVSFVENSSYGKRELANKKWFEKTFESEETWNDIKLILEKKDILTKNEVNEFVEKYKENPFVMPLLLECNNISLKTVQDTIKEQCEKQKVSGRYWRDKEFYTMSSEIFAANFPPLIRNTCLKDMLHLLSLYGSYTYGYYHSNEKNTLDIAKEVYYNLEYEPNYLGIISVLKPYNTLTEEKINQEFNKMLTYKWTREEQKQFGKLEQRYNAILSNDYINDENTTIILDNGEYDYSRTGKKMTNQMADELYDVIMANLFDLDSKDGAIHTMFTNLMQSGKFNSAKQYDFISRFISEYDSVYHKKKYLFDRFIYSYINPWYWYQSNIEYNPCAVKMLLNSKFKNIYMDIMENRLISDKTKLYCMDDCLEKIKKQKITKSKGRFMALIKNIGSLITLEDKRYEEILKHMDSPDDSYKSIKNKTKFQEMVIEISSSPKTPLKYLQEFQKRNETDISIRIAKYGNLHNLTKRQTDALFFATERSYSGNIGKTIKNIEFLNDIFNCDELATEKIDLKNYIEEMLKVCEEQNKFSGYKQNLLELKDFSEKYIEEYAMDKDVFLQKEFPSQYFVIQKNEIINKINKDEYGVRFARNDIVKNMVKYFDEYIKIRREKDINIKDKKNRENEIAINEDEIEILVNEDKKQSIIKNSIKLADITDFEDEIVEETTKSSIKPTLELMDFDEER